MNSKNRVYQVVAAIPKGKVLCYQDVAKLAGIKSPRWAGRYLHVNEDTNFIPCHRVVRKNVGGECKDHSGGGFGLTLGGLFFEPGFAALANFSGFFHSGVAGEESILF